MSRAYACYIHKRGVMTPDLRIVACDRARDLPGAILNQMPTWGEFEKVEVFDADDQPMFSFIPELQQAH